MEKRETDLSAFLVHLNKRLRVEGGSQLHKYMTYLAHEAMKITAELNGAYHSPEEIRELFSELTGKRVDESFGLFPPFYTGGQGCFYQFGLPFSGPRRDHDRRRRADWAQCRARNAQSWICTGRPEVALSGTDRDRKKCMAGRERDGSAGCYHWRQCGYRRRRGCQQGCARKHGRRRHTGRFAQDD